MKGDDRMAIQKALSAIVKSNVGADGQNWLESITQSADQSNKISQAFVMVPRKTGKSLIQLNEEQKVLIEEAGISYISHWTIDRLCRVWLLSTLNSIDQDKRYATIDRLFLSAEMNEAVALYSALPFLAHSEIWVKRCAEGIRSNIGSVLEAIMENNPYPSENLDEAAWNQLVLKAFFTEKNIKLIIGLDKRANLELALTLIDYAKERWAAKRKVNPQLWRLVGKFINAEIFETLKIGLQHYDQIEQRAIALAIAQSDYQPAKDYINTFPELKLALTEGGLNWDSF
ncbi:EboA domain-containing protein [Pedobacter sp. ISL-68]|uniref:EboA domain-containing protein n=1 Tax=unclassified Pedobacter TaxID=2628915 RepID=UPI001BE6C5BB|nr:MULTISPECIES: EboA domain-containing protein [unclassified Pedobacter]MBT2560514.1 EboA domain-containing protein [Pedobacter sp. ISL-64]MBT2593247.1 EboA domain-containing protein [Pedobacter sp. ISL-68]